MQSIFGALLTAGYAAAAGAAIAASGKNITQSVQNELTKSFSSAADAAQQYPSAQASKIIAGAKTSFLQGQHWASLAGIIAVLIGMVVVHFFFPNQKKEQELLVGYQAESAAPAAEPEARKAPAAPAHPRVA